MTSDLIYLASREHARDLERLAVAVRSERRRRAAFGHSLWRLGRREA